MQQAKNNKDVDSEDMNKKQFQREIKPYEKERKFRNSSRKQGKNRLKDLNMPSDQELEDQVEDNRDLIEITNIGININTSADKMKKSNKNRLK